MLDDDDVGGEYSDRSDIDPPHTPGPEFLRRDFPFYDNPRITAFANRVLAQDDAIEYRFEALGNTYGILQIHVYAFLSLGFEDTAQIFAREISFDSVISFYLDLGTGTGFIVRVCI